MAVHQPPKCEPGGIRIIYPRLDRRRALHPQRSQPLCLMRSINSAWEAEMFQRMGNNLFQKSPIVCYLRFNRRSTVVDRPLMAVRVKLNVNSVFSQLPELLLVQGPKQVLRFDVREGDIERFCHFFKELQAIGSG